MANRIKPINSQPIVSSLSIAFKKATMVTEDVVEAKREHRSNLKVLVDKYMQDINDGKAEGIRTAKELVEVIKADMLLLGEATERSDDVNSVDEIRVKRIQQVLDESSDQDLQSLVSTVMSALNDANDDLDTNPSKPMYEEHEVTEIAEVDLTAGMDLDAEDSDDGVPKGAGGSE